MFGKKCLLACAKWDIAANTKTSLQSCIIAWCQVSSKKPTAWLSNGWVQYNANVLWRALLDIGLG